MIANGQLGTRVAANAILADGKTDIVALGKSALANRDWRLRALNGDGFEELDAGLLQPLAHIKSSEL